MSSEAAQKAYPDLVRGDDERYDDFEVRETIMAYSRAAFDRGAVEALNAAIERAQRTGFWADAIDALFDLRDEWVVGQ